MDRNFFWGAATSAHQVEGGNHNDWTEWEKANAKLKAQEATLRQAQDKWPDYILSNYPNPLQEENYISGRACDHYNRFREDFDIAKSLGHNAHRFSIEWSRVEPEEGKFDEKEIAHYREVIRALRERGLEPFVTLWHYTLPVWLANKGGVLNKKFPEYFAKYTAKLAGILSSEIKFWITVNEPEVYSGLSYFKGRWPPQKKSIFAFYKSISHLIKAHNRAHHEIKEKSPTAIVGTALHAVYFESAGGFINNVLKRIADRAWNFYFLNRIRKSLDFIGINYYFHNRVNYGFNKNANTNASDMNWEIYPEGIYHTLKKIDKYSKPIYITENGLADLQDAQRAKFIKDHIEWIKKAVDEGADVRGYLYWSLLDNFEWADGFWPRFGLVEIDYKTMERKIRPSALAYKKLMTNDT